MEMPDYLLFVSSYVFALHAKSLYQMAVIAAQFRRHILSQRGFVNVSGMYMHNTLINITLMQKKWHQVHI